MTNQNLSSEPLLSEDDIRRTKVYRTKVILYEEYLVAKQKQGVLKVFFCLFIALLLILIAFYLILLTTDVLLYSTLLVLCLVALAFYGFKTRVKPEQLVHDPEIPHSNNTFLRCRGYLLVINNDKTQVDVFHVCKGGLKLGGLKLNSTPVYSSPMTPSQIEDLEDEVALVMEDPNTPPEKLPILTSFLDTPLIRSIN